MRFSRVQRRLIVAGVALAGSGASVYAQISGKQINTFGSIIGHVYCADTNAPARMAKVLLLPKANSTTKNKSEGSASLPGAGTDFDGAFRIDNVPAGEYYVYALLPGYLDVLAGFSKKELESQDPAEADRVRQKISVVRVQESGAITADLRIERAGSIAGTVDYDDGTPVPDSTVSILVGEGEGEAKPQQPTPMKTISPFLFDQVGTVTDDHGRFRIAGVREGRYSLKVTLASPKRISYSSELPWVEDSGNQMMISVYLGDTLRWKDAGTVALGAGEEKTGVDITVPLQGLHTIAGIVEAKTDGHRINSGTVRLNGTDDTSFERKADLQDGTFEFDLVPAGNYTVEVQNAKDTKGRLAKAEGRTIFVVDTLGEFGSAKVPVILQTTDIMNVVLTVPLAKHE
jgi:hypothetical protein